MASITSATIPSDVTASDVQRTTSLHAMLLYAAIVLLVEVACLILPAIAALGLNGLLLALLLILTSRSRTPRQQHVLLGLVLIPLIRLVTLLQPITAFPTLYWPLIIGVPLCLAAYFIMRTTRLTLHDIGFVMRSWRIQLLVALSGIVLGYDEYLIIHSAPIARPPSWALVLITAPIMLMFAALLEELLFRGLMQRLIRDVHGVFGSVFTAILFALLHVASLTPLNLLFAFVIGLYFSFVVARTRSIVGVVLAHGLWSISLYLVFPLLLGR
jgi:uncharacterized protein